MTIPESAQETRPANPSQDQMLIFQEGSEGSQHEEDHESNPEVSFHFIITCNHPPVKWDTHSLWLGCHALY